MALWDPINKPYSESCHPEWLDGKVPYGFWGDDHNHTRYMQWLGKQLGYKKTDDWYQLTRRLLIENHAGGLVELFGHSPQKILMDYMPEGDWKPWMFVSTQNNFWTKAENRRQYLQWLEKQLGITDPDDWYEIKVRAFYDHHGGSLMQLMNNNIIKTLKDLYPGHNFYPWKFQQVSKRFWRDKKNRLDYLRWLGKELGFKRQTDWLKLRAVDFSDNHGETVFAEHYRRSMVKVVSELYPNRICYEWEFHRVPTRFFSKKANRIRYLQWVNKKLRIKNAEQWDTFRKQDFLQHCGTKFLPKYYGNSLERAISEAKQALRLNQR